MAHVFSTQSKAGNEFFEVKFRTTETTCVTIRIMKLANQTITEDYLRRLNQEREPVTFKKLSKTPKGEFFFNTSKGSIIQKSTTVNFNFNQTHYLKVEAVKAHNLGILDAMGWVKYLPGNKSIQSPGKVSTNIREAIFFDHSGHIGITIWGKFTQLIEEGKKYELNNLNLKNFFVKKLSTTTSTTIALSEEQETKPVLTDDVTKSYIDHEKEINVALNPQLCCPELMGTNVTIDAACTNIKCAKPVATVPGEKTVTCMNCNNMMRVEKCKCIFKCMLLFENITLLLPADVASLYFKEDIMMLYQRDEKKLKNMLCFLENVDYTYNSKNIVTKMSDHQN